MIAATAILPSDPLGLSYTHISPQPIREAKYSSVEYSPRGAYLKVRPRLTANNLRQRGGGKRGAVGGFSRQSQQRLRKLMHCLDSSLPLPLFLTLTYPAAWPDDPTRWKRDLDVQLKAIIRKFPDSVIIWKLEPQKRGAPHFHTVIYTESRLARKWISASWYRIVGSGDKKHLAAGTKIERARSRPGALAYMTKYLGKRHAPVAGWEAVGRYWGVRNRPKGMVKTRHITAAAAYRIRRVLWKLRASQSREHKRTPYRGDEQGTVAYISGALVRRLLGAIDTQPPPL